MQGLELCRRYYYEYGEKMLCEQFSSQLSHIAVGLCGEGSECLGYDDEISADHDFEPGFCIFTDDTLSEDDKEMYRLEKAYASLPKEFLGYKKSSFTPSDGKRHGVIPASDFFLRFTATTDGKPESRQLCLIPDYALLCATNGEIFRDDSGFFTSVRNYLAKPDENVILKKLAGYLLVMAQSGQYNYSRCEKHRESGAKSLSVYEFVKAAIQVIYILNNRYMPYYKWCFRGMRKLEHLSSLEGVLCEMLEGTHNAEIIDDICTMVASECIKLGFGEKYGGDLERFAYSVNSRIKDNNLRCESIFLAVK